MQKRYIVICLILLFTIILLHPIIFPCLIASIAAYLLNPLVSRLEKFKISRLYSVILVTFLLLLIFILSITLVLPIICAQVTSILDFLIKKVPSLESILILPILEFFNINLDINYFFEEIFKSYTTYLIDALKVVNNLMLGVLSSSLNFISLIVITPVIFFYVLRDWPSIIEQVNKLIPIPYKKNVAYFFVKVDSMIFSYLKGQINVCIIMMIFYSITLSILKLKHAIVIAILSGTLTFVPYIGPLIYSTIGFLSAITQFSGWFESIIVLLLFLTGQLLDSYILTPLLIGKKINIHPAIIIFGITICASYFGFIGILLFIPIVSIFIVSTELVVNKYRKSEFYKSG
ncbi:AI-2E family transporter [Wolbachia pipientis]|uniref:AI-2E family transporter n=1 Tax=Wolbachia pipientis TaxID=955 RepID=A0A1E7QLS7_WOLPI|nr:AI-2E family transporter [Wolbachia pipientis]OEY87174.1 AI-2E family transporter [Wolbachia pipientis]